MRSVSVIGTFHAEAGRTSSAKLHEILERIGPEVIFLEAPVGSLNNQSDVCKLNNLEAAAVSMYCDSKAISLVAVDLPTPDESFFRNTHAVFREIECKSYEYCRLVDEQSRRIREEGFTYLNGDGYQEFQSALKHEIHETLQLHGNKGMRETYASWLRVMELRDEEMLSNIYAYCRENEFTKAVFLVGAAHRRAIVDRTSSLPQKGTAEVLWDYPECGE